MNVTIMYIICTFTAWNKSFNDFVGKKKKEGSGFEAALEAAETDEKKVEAKKRFPGLCLPDNPNRAMQLLVPEDSKDMRVAKSALDEVSESGQ